MDTNFSTREKIVGLFMVIVVGLMVVALVVLGRGKGWFQSYVIYYTTFAQNYNLQKNAAVKLYKADIGRVKDISLEEDKVRVTLAILEKYASRIRTDTVCVVASPTFIGSEYVSIIPGSATAPALPPKSEIPSREKRSLEELMDEFQVEKTAKMAVIAIQDLSALMEVLRSPDGPLLGTLENVRRISANVAAITDDLESGQGTLGALINSHRLLDEIRRSLGSLDLILADLGQAAAHTPETIKLVNENLEAFKQAGADLRARMADISRIVSDLQASTAYLKTIMENIAAGSGNVPRITQGALDGIQEIRSGVRRIDKVVRSLEKNFLIRGNLPPEKLADHSKTRLRQ